MTLKEFDDSYRIDESTCVAGFDEAGRGPVCGPVVCAGVILDSSFNNEFINDSKKLSEKKREELFPLIKERALAYKIVFIEPSTIDEINILEASRLGMQKALDYFINNSYKVDVVLTDYMKIDAKGRRFDSLVKGDGKSLAIACASILAKVSRDLYMKELAKKYPEYELDKHKGYPTKRHLQILERLGPLKEIYRFSYKPVINVINNNRK